MKFIDIETSQGLSEDPDAALIAHKSRVDLVGVSELGDEDNVTVTSNFIHIPELVGPGPLCGHNVKFDIKTLVFKGVPINVSQLEHDTLLMAVASYKKVPDSYIEHYEARRRELNKSHKKGHGYRAAKKHSLKVLAPFFLNVPAFWENPETTNDEEYLKKDVRYTAMLFHFLKAELEQQGTWDFYQSKILPWARMTLQAEIDGICINVDKMAELWKKADAGVISSQKVLRAAWKEVEEEYAEKQKAEIKAQYEEMKTKALAKDTKKPRTPDQVAKVAERYDNLQSQALARLEPFNYASPSQLLWAMKDKLKYDVTDWVGEEGTGADILMRLANSGKEDIKALLEYREHNKLSTSYFPSYENLMHKGRIHCNFNIHGTKTGRLSCIAEGEQITVPGGTKPIQEISAGDIVYCYDASGKVRTAKVKQTFNNGKKDCVKIKWQSSGTGRIGYLICTPDHKIKRKSGEWAMAQELSHGQKLSHVTRSKELRPRLYGSNSYCEREQELIKREWFKESSDKHIHHIDHNPNNNALTNLAVLSAKEHTAMHAAEYHKANPEHWKHLLKGERANFSGAENGNYIKVDKFSVLRKIAEARGRLTYVGMDFDTFKKKAKIVGVDLKSACSRYSSTGKFLNRKTLLAELNNNNVDIAAKNLGIGTRRLKSICKDLGLEYNHMVLSVKPAGVYNVYDLEVEEHHNYIASEICVHNCNDPNLQQIPSDLKQLFVAAPGNKLVSLDLSAIEPALIAYYSEDQALCEILIHKDDFHGTAAVEFFELKIPANKVKQEQKSLRDAAKTSDLALFYGTGHKKLWSILRLAGLSYSLDQCKGMLERYKHKFREVYRFKYNLDQTCYSGEVIETMLGRKFRIDNMDDVYMKAFNRLVQSSASDLLLKATQDFLAEMPEARLRLLVHDNTVVEVPAHLAQKAYDRLFYHMTKFKLETKHGAIPLNAEGGINDFWE